MKSNLVRFPIERVVRKMPSDKKRRRQRLRDDLLTLLVISAAVVVVTIGLVVFFNWVFA